MAETAQLVANFTPDVRAATDLRSYQYFAVCFGAAGVYLTDQNYGPGSGAVWILGNKPAAGQPCELVAGPNLYKTVVATTVVRNQWLAVAVQSGMLGVGSQASLGRVGVALMPTQAGSGELLLTRLTL
jgi:hypothetical protein